MDKNLQQEIDEGAALLAQARAGLGIMAKAQGSDLDDDFDELDDAQGQHAMGDEADSPDGHEDDEDEDEDGNGEENETFQKAANSGRVFDAMPILQSLDQRLEALATENREIKAQLGEFLTVAKAQQAALGHFAKAQGAMVSLPQRPKSQQVRVAQREPSAQNVTKESIMAKAESLPDMDSSIFSQLTAAYTYGSAHDMLQYLTPAQRAAVQGGA